MVISNVLLLWCDIQVQKLPRHVIPEKFMYRLICKNCDARVHTNSFCESLWSKYCQMRKHKAKNCGAKIMKYCNRCNAVSYRNREKCSNFVLSSNNEQISQDNISPKWTEKYNWYSTLFLSPIRLRTALQNKETGKILVQKEENSAKEGTSKNKIWGKTFKEEKIIAEDSTWNQQVNLT